jgi:predicted ATPase/class 3 adenylate cyclase
MSELSDVRAAPNRAAICLACGFANPIDFSFCGACGSRLSAVSDVAIPGRRVEAERRQLTVLFCDLVGSTRLATNLELDEWRDVLRGFQITCTKVVRQFGGTISRYMGDGILVLFGYPHAHEDDAERAVSAALTMVEAVGRLPSPLDATERLAVRIGIATGVVLAGDLIGDGAAEEEAILGETPNLAGRLQAAAPPNGVVIAARTHALIGGRFHCEDLGAHQLKGFDEPVPCWRVVRPRRFASHFTAMGAGGRAPVVGRKRELAWLLDCWRTAAAGRGDVVTLVGEAGIGKSRLAEALREHLGSSCVPLRFQCSPHYVHSALNPVIQHIEMAARIGPEDQPATKFAKLSAWLGPLADGVPADLPVLAALLSISGDAAPPLPAMSAQRRKQDTFDALFRLVRMRATISPLLVIFEDLHWADPTTLEFLSAFGRAVGDMPVLGILTFRPGLAVPWTGQQVQSRELQRLPRGPAVTLVERIAGTGRMPEAVLEQVVLRADGVPLFIEELTQAVLGLGVLDEGSDGPGGPRPRRPEFAIPATLQDSLMARLDQLGPAKLVAQLASVIGREFSYPLLSAIAPLPAERLQTELAVLEAAGLIHPKSSLRSDVFTFKHALVQEVAYQTLLRSRRHELHTRIATILERRFPQQARDAPELVAHHWTQAGEFEHAIAGWLAAGERASERSEYSEALGHLRRGVDLVGHLPGRVRRRDRELALLLALGPALMMVTGAGTPEVARLYERALELCEGVPTSGLHFAARWGRWRAAKDRGAGLERADDLLRLAQELGDPAQLVQAHHCQWATLYMFGAHEECCRHAEEGIRLYDRERHRLKAHLYGGHDPKVCALGERALSSWLLGRLDEGLTSVRLALEWAESLAHVGSHVHALDYALQVHRLRRDAAEVARVANTMVEFATEQHMGEHRAKGMLFRGWATAFIDDAVGGLDEMREALAMEEEVGTPEEFPLYYEMFAEVCEQAGRFDEGLDAVRKGFVQVERGGLLYWNAELHRRRGELTVAAGGDQAVAAECFEHALAEAQGQGASFLVLRAATSLARLRGDERSMADLRVAYAGFPPDLDAPDLREVRELLAVHA